VNLAQIGQVILVPTGGHSDDAGNYIRGRSVGPFSEVDIVHGYLRGIIDELDAEGILFNIMPTLHRPGIAVSKRPDYVGSNCLVLHLKAGWFKSNKCRIKNTTYVKYGDKQSKEIAEHLTESIGEWGKCIVYGHGTSAPAPDPSDSLLGIKDTWSLSIEPFAINGPEAEEYCRHLESLGKAIGFGIAQYLKRKKLAQGRRVATLV